MRAIKISKRTASTPIFYISGKTRIPTENNHQGICCKNYIETSTMSYHAIAKLYNIRPGLNKMRSDLKCLIRLERRISVRFGSRKRAWSDLGRTRLERLFRLVAELFLPAKPWSDSTRICVLPSNQKSRHSIPQQPTVPSSCFILRRPRPPLQPTVLRHHLQWELHPMS